MSKKITYGKILMAIAASFVISGFLKSEVFNADSPRVNPNAVRNVLVRAVQLITAPGNAIARLIRGPSVAEQLKDIPFTPSAPGIYAKQKDNLLLKEYRENEVRWLEYTFIHEGKLYTIRYAEGDQLPSKEVLEKLVR